MSKFKRGIKKTTQTVQPQVVKSKKILNPQLVKTKPWLDPNFDALRPDRKKIPKATKEERWRCNIHIAKKMMKDFCWRPWMEDFIDRDGNDKPFKKGILV